MNTHIIKWLLLPITTSFLLVLLSIFYGFIKCNDYADTVFLTIVSLFNIYPGIVHCFKQDTGLVDIAGMKQITYDKHRHVLIIFHPMAGSLQLCLGLFELYIIYFRQEMVLDMIVFVVLCWIFKVIYGQTVKHNERQIALDMLLPNAPGRQHVVGGSILFLFYMIARYLHTSLHLKQHLKKKK
eukprot:881248_1